MQLSGSDPHHDPLILRNAVRDRFVPFQAHSAKALLLSPKNLAEMTGTPSQNRASGADQVLR